MTKVKTFRKKRVMTEEQKQAAADRLRAAREKRLRENPPQYKNIHPSVLARDEDDELNMKNVRQWIKTTKERIRVERANARNNVKGALALVGMLEGYVRNMEGYLKTGDWIDTFYGEFMDKKCTVVCHTMAYYECGLPKRTVGVFYRDINRTWTEEMDVPYREEVRQEMRKNGR